MKSRKLRKRLADTAVVTLTLGAVIAFTFSAGEYALSETRLDDLKPIEPIKSEVVIDPISDQEIAFPEAEPKIKYINLGEFKITAYCACEKCCGSWANKRPLDENGDPIVYGSTGNELVSEYSIAVDPSVIPYGSEIVFGGREYIAHDTGGAIKGNRIDIYMGSHEAALEWGVQYYDVYAIID